MPKIFCHIPEVCIHSDADISKQVRQQLRAAIDLKLDVMGLPRGTKTSVVDLEDDLATWVQERSNVISMIPGRIVGGLLYALHQHDHRGQPPVSKQAQPGLSSLVPLQGLRPPQARCLTEAAPLLQQGRVVASELGTGSGKGRLAAHAAAYMLALRDADMLPALPVIDADSKDDGDTPLFYREAARDAQQNLSQVLQERPARAVVICAPSIDNVLHLVREWHAVVPNIALATPAKTAVVFGLGQFVSPTRLLQILDDIEHPAQEILQWVEDGMPTGLTPATRSLKALDPRFKGLMADLQHIAAELGIPSLDCEQDSDTPIEERELYDALVASAASADVIFTTHAMVCMDNRLLASPDKHARAKLPPAIGLVVDEAHLLESNQAGVMSSTISGYRLAHVLNSEEWVSLRKASAAKRAADELRAITQILSVIPENTLFPIASDSPPEVHEAWQIARMRFKDLRKSLGALVKGVDLSNANHLTSKQRRAASYARRCEDALSRLFEASSGQISFTAKQRHIQLDIGPQNVGKYLFQRWAVTPMGLLMSGTLLHISGSGISVNALRREMGVALTRVVITRPLHPSWITESAKLMLPKKELWARFLPPDLTKDQQAELRSWASPIAQAISLAANDSAGGLLVLTSSYARVLAIAEHLRANEPAIDERLIVQTQSQGVVPCTSLFKSAARKGLRPVWIATGSAGTGLDLSDETVSEAQSSQDLLLTDLVITNLPFGLDRSPHHASKMQNIGFGVESVAAQRRFRQWLGRLIRRQGLLRRRIWVLDGRLSAPFNQSLVVEFHRILDAYIHKEYFDLRFSAGESEISPAKSGA